jgi:tetratricopeptide (TPR) repeat protein
VGAARTGRRGAAGGADGGDADDTAIDHLCAALDRAPAGLHDLGEPTVDVPLDWPVPLSDVYLAFDGGRLFHEELVLAPAAEVARDRDGDAARWHVGELGGAPIAVDARGRVWRTDDETGEDVVDGTTPARWLRGVVDGLAVLFDGDGEYVDEAFDDDGELAPAARLAMARAQVRRDPKAPGPRWRLARLMAAAGEVEPARRELERVVDAAPGLAWAWLDLARLSEALGELGGAFDEAVAAAEAAPGHEHEAYFWAQAARLAARRGNEADRARCATRAVAIDPGLVAAELAGAEQNLADGDLDSARALVDLALAVAPRDLAALDLARRLVSP